MQNAPHDSCSRTAGTCWVALVAGAPAFRMKAVDYVDAARLIASVLPDGIWTRAEVSPRECTTADGADLPWLDEITADDACRRAELRIESRDLAAKSDRAIADAEAFLAGGDRRA